MLWFFSSLAPFAVNSSSSVKSRYEAVHNRKPLTPISGFSDTRTAVEDPHLKKSARTVHKPA
jgi:hypothetical protein